ncbi:MAG: FAD-dependent monooxygenase [Alphaproteobacteria bacterium]|nr:FAD-dependent monooxygenase [Alphaproteobacteria bacterium]
MSEWLIVGAGIGGLAAALALQRQGVLAQLWEQAPAFGEAGAGIQLGPNTTRLLRAWGLDAGLRKIADRPQALISRDARDGAELGRLDLSDFEQRYGAPYLCIHRADLHALLWAAIDSTQVLHRLDNAMVDIRLGAEGRPLVTDARGSVQQPGAVIGADGLWSRVRHTLWQDGPPTPTGHWAYRTMLPTRLLSPRWREPQVQVWMAPGLHAVHYPVRQGEWLNLVVLVESSDTVAAPGWDISRAPGQIQADLHQALRGLCPDLHDVLRSAEQWRAWALSHRAPLRSPDDMARGRVALLGDAAHPMLPYMAQGAGMAMEDAWQLAQSLAQWPGADASQVLQDYAQARWARNARVQRKAMRNGEIFHARGLQAWARNAALRMAAPRLMDQPWLYGAN